MIHGRDVIVAISGHGAVAASKGCSIDVNNSFIDVCAPTEGTTKRKVRTTYSWDVSCDCLAVTTDELAYFLDAVKNGTEMNLRWFVGGIKQGGKAFVSSYKIGATVGSLTTMSISFVGSGPMLDKTSEGPDFVNGVLKTYSNFNDGVLTINGAVNNNGLWQPDSAL